METNTQTKVRVVSARVSVTNTPESDLQPQVWHDVHLSDGMLVKVMATDPLDAMNKIKERL